ncbi:succinate dehydrogenase, cytochrome b556 subunit [Chitinimonas sp.]|uniref:succinate dehydrogenase, cytochrome b556 subunit n=1 Tax=Chitinimonas sp. TaxID=1934313 RepID=UPI002F955AFF
MEKARPKHLDLPKIRLPIPGIVSILHRVSGILMFLAIPVMLWLLAGSLSNEARYDAFRGFISYPIVKLGLIAVLWAYLHHACAGIRFLLLDVHKGLELQTARATAKAVMIVSLVLTAVIGGLLW